MSARSCRSALSGRPTGEIIQIMNKITSPKPIQAAESPEFKEEKIIDIAQNIQKCDHLSSSEEENVSHSLQESVGASGIIN